MKIDFKVKRAEDCALIDTKKWVDNASTGITLHRLSGRDIPTGITELKSVYPVKEGLKNIIKEGDLVLISKVAADISQYRKFAVERGDERYFHVPIMQVYGIFKNHNINYDSFQLVTDKVLLKRLEPKYSGILKAEDNTMIGEVVKIGTNKFDENWNSKPLTVKVGDRVIVRDNVSTEIYLDGERYYVVEEPTIIGIFKDEDRFELESLRIFNNSILLEPYIPKNICDSIIITPNMNYEDADYTELYNRDLFKVAAVDQELDKIHRNDILLIDRNFTNYVYLGTKKYFTISGLNFVSAKIN